MSTLRVAWHLERAAFRGQLEYRLDFVILLLMGVAYQSSGLAFIWVVLQRFDTIGGWSFHELVFLYALRLLAHVVWYIPFNQIGYVDQLVREGVFDQILVRPMNPLLQVMTRKFSMNIVGDAVLCVALFSYAVATAPVHLSAIDVVYIALAVLGGALAEGAFVLMVSSLAFRVLQTWALDYLVDNVYLMFGSYPLRIFGFAASWAFTWIVPVAFVSYIPSSVLLGRSGELHIPTVVAGGAPAVGVLWFVLAYQVWRRQLRSYQSSGH
ncbi:MAG: ABC transporter permease [Acidothermaceae bacterium]